MSLLLAVLILAASNSELPSRGLMSADACRTINRIAEELSNEGRSAIAAQRSLSPFQKQCLHIIETGSLETNEAQLKERLSALDNISFYWNAAGVNTDSASLVSNAELLRSAIERIGEVTQLDIEIVRSINEENRSRQWLDSMDPGGTAALKVSEVGNGKKEPFQVTLFSLEGEQIMASHVDLQQIELVIVGSCHIAKQAARELTDSIEAQHLLSRRKILWIEPASRHLDTGSVQRWNETFPNYPMSVATRNSEWIGMDMTASPAFYLLKNGRVVATHRGWSRDGSIPEPLLKMLRSR
jgi:hypothetical protein